MHDRGTGEAALAGELGTVLREHFSAFDRKDLDAALRVVHEDAEAVDEISRRWMRGRDAIREYGQQLFPAIENVHSELEDMHETVWDDVGLVTCWLEQDYTYQGQPQHVSAPTSAVFRRAGGLWRIALLHTIPLPEETP
jgi:ketosteroid isomerase-like protein